MTTAPRPGRVKRLVYFAGGLLAVLALFVVAAVVWARTEILASLPRLDGEQRLPGLTAAVDIERDRLGVPTIRASNRLDLARATGFVHGQDRFFQMDLMRRRAAGELSEIVGPAMLENDRRVRVHRFRARCDDYLARESAEDTALYRAYADGVNAGLASLGTSPPEYVLLREQPAAWLTQDTLLVLFAMYLDLQGDDGRRESSLGLVHDLLPAELARFLTPPGTEWDAPLTGQPYTTPATPGPAIYDLRAEGAAVSGERGARPFDAPLPGSNSWAIAGSRSANGAALLANDMHLALRLPNIWYRASLVLTDPESGEERRRFTGVTLPGAPTMVVGSNGDIAWGFTNSQVDTSDLVIVEHDPENEDRYLTPDGPRAYERHEETIAVRGAAGHTFEVVSTIWGPIVDHDHLGRPRALRWTAHDTTDSEIRMDAVWTAVDVEQALDLASRSSAPTQNFVVADRSGRIGWTLAGPVPRRVGFDGARPTSWADGSRRWDGRLEPGEYPRVLDHESGSVWTANNRVVDEPELRKIGHGGYALGARARQIRDGLRALNGPIHPRDLLALQLDDRALFLERWRELLLATLTEEALAADPRRRELRRLVENDWSGHASVDSVGYRMVRGFRMFLSSQIFDALTAPCREADERFGFKGIGQWEGPLWRLIHERPAHLLDPRFESWDDQLLAGVDETLDYFLADGATPLADRSWGQRNTVRVRHPLSLAVPALGRWLDLPAQPLPGDAYLPRVQSPGFGASQRMVVSPGHEDEGLLHMPGGQSGHPFSPYYRKGHSAWAGGEATPLLPGPAEHRLRLLP